MAQGTLKKLKQAPKSAGAAKRKVVRSKALSKGRKHKNARRSHAVQSAKPEVNVTKQINKKNEAIVAAKAVASGDRFFLKDIADSGTKEHKGQIKARDKKQDKSTNFSGRLKDQIQQLQKGTKLRK